jgi:hypothetical protein
MSSIEPGLDTFADVILDPAATGPSEAAERGAQRFRRRVVAVRAMPPWRSLVLSGALVG